jgi:hypothetical protein
MEETTVHDILKRILALEANGNGAGHPHVAEEATFQVLPHAKHFFAWGEAWAPVGQELVRLERAATTEEERAAYALLDRERRAQGMIERREAEEQDKAAAVADVEAWSRVSEEVKAKLREAFRLCRPFHAVGSVYVQRTADGWTLAASFSTKYGHVLTRLQPWLERWMHEDDEEAAGHMLAEADITEGEMATLLRLWEADFSPLAVRDGDVLHLESIEAKVRGSRP